MLLVVVVAVVDVPLEAVVALVQAVVAVQQVVVAEEEVVVVVEEVEEEEAVECYPLCLPIIIIPSHIIAQIMHVQ